MAKNSSQIIKDFKDHLKISGKRYYSDFYVGISKNAQKRLFDEHHVDKDNSWWIFRTATTSKDARDVEKHFIELGMRGGTGGGDDTANMIYCYAITPTTTER